MLTENTEPSRSGTDVWFLRGNINLSSSAVKAGGRNGHVFLRTVRAQ